MKFVTISDVHIKNSGDAHEQLFLKFLESEEVSKADTIFLLGDIFDLLVGGHLEYETKFPQTFNKLRELLLENKKIVQIEGNHDFHFEGLVKKLLNKWSLPRESWAYLTVPVVKTIGDHKILFAHGDEIELNNPGYQRYRKIIRSPFIEFLANKVVPYRIVNAIGERASAQSRARHKSRYEETPQISDEVKDSFREAFRVAKKKYDVDTVICGHSHCQDFYKEEGLYCNNGYFPQSKTFHYFNGEGLSPISLSD